MNVCKNRRHHWMKLYEHVSSTEKVKLEAFGCSCGRRKNVTTHDDGSVLKETFFNGRRHTVASGRYRNQANAKD